MGYRKAASLLLVVCCIGLLCYVAVNIVLSHLGRQNKVEVPLVAVEKLDFGQHLLQRVANNPGTVGSVNINTADGQTLMTLPGIGPHLSEQILLRRAQQPFYFLEDLMTVRGIGAGRLEALRGLAYVDFPQDVIERLLASVPVTNAELNAVE